MRYTITCKLVQIKSIHKSNSNDLNNKMGKGRLSCHVNKKVTINKYKNLKLLSYINIISHISINRPSMSGIILPTVDFSDVQKYSTHNKSTKVKNNVKSARSIKTKDRESTSESNSDIDIDDIDGLIYKDDYPPSEESESSKETSGDDNEEINTIDEPPIYDGEEDYYIFKRRWDMYMNNKLHQNLHTHILSFINTLFDTTYTSLVSIKKIEENKIPAPKYVVDVIKEDENYRKLFKIKYSLSIPSHKMIDSLLNKINFSFVKVENKNGNYYRVKTGIINKLDTR